MSRVSERSGCSADRTHGGAERAVASGALAGQLSCNSGRDTQLSEGRNLTHGLDFNSLRSYNGAACRGRGRGRKPNRSSADGI